MLQSVAAAPAGAPEPDQAGVCPRCGWMAGAVRIVPYVRLYGPETRPVRECFKVTVWVADWICPNPACFNPGNVLRPAWLSFTPPARPLSEVSA